MGLFSKKEAGSTRRQAARPRPSVSSEAQAASLRVKARRRLTGAVALVLAVVIVLPMLLDGEPEPIPSGINIVIPNQSQPLEPLTTTTIETPVNSGTDTQALTTEPAPIIPTAPTTIPTAPTTPVTPAAVERPVTASTPAPIPPVAREAPAASETKRTDDGSRALALLAGQSPSKAAPAAPTTGEFVVQIASYSSQEDAQSRRDKLRGEGVSNAFVEQGSIEGKNVFRLRVGPFVSRDAAQAAQTRLRTLGYNNGFITTK
jgi:DedD protein